MPVELHNRLRRSCVGACFCMYGSKGHCYGACLQDGAARLANDRQVDGIAGLFVCVRCDRASASKFKGCTRNLGV